MAPSSSNKPNTKKRKYALSIPALSESLTTLRPDLSFTHPSLLAIQASHAMFLHLIASELAALQDQKEKASLSSGSNTTTARHSDLQQAMGRVGFGSLWEQATAYLQTIKTNGDDESSTKVVKTKKRKRKPPEITQEMIDEQERLLAQSQQKQNALSKKST